MPDEPVVKFVRVRLIDLDKYTDADGQTYNYGEDYEVEYKKAAALLNRRHPGGGSHIFMKSDNYDVQTADAAPPPGQRRGGAMTYDGKFAGKETEQTEGGGERKMAQNEVDEYNQKAGGAKRDTDRERGDTSGGTPTLTKQDAEKKLSSSAVKNDPEKADTDPPKKGTV